MSLEIGKIYGEHGVKIRIESLDPVTATVVEVDPFWHRDRIKGNKYGTESIGFLEGETLVFQEVQGGVYSIKSPMLACWFVLRDDGNFEHYR